MLCVSAAGRIMAKKSYEKIKERRREQTVVENVEDNTEEYAGDYINANGKEAINEDSKNSIKERGKEQIVSGKPDSFRNVETEKGSLGVEPAKTKVAQEKANAVQGRTQLSREKFPGVGGIKTWQSRREVFYPSSEKGVKTISVQTGASVLSVNKKDAVHTLTPQKTIRHTHIQQKAAGYAAASKRMAGAAAIQKKQADYAIRASKQMAVRSAKAVGETAQTAKRTTKIAVRGIIAAVKAAVSSIKALMTFAMAGGGLATFLIIIVGVIGGVLLSSNSQSAESLSQEVLDHTPVIQRYAQEYGISEYVQVIQAIMMQESRGQGNDPMQASECPFNTRYPNSPDAITDPEYSIQVGIQYYAYCVQEAGCTSPQDLDKLKLSIQGYNFGNGYISWAIRNHGGYSEANALQFSQEQAAAHGWSGYGDPEYVPHVMR